MTFSSRSKQLVFTETDKVCEPPEKYVLISYVVHRGDLELQSAKLNLNLSQLRLAKDLMWALKRPIGTF